MAEDEALDAGQEDGGIFTSFISPALNLIDRGVILRKGFGLLYGIIAVIELLAPVAVLALCIGRGYFKVPIDILIVFILLWCVYSFACWLMFQVWWNRGKRIHRIIKESNDFVAIPLVANFIKTLGEAAAFYLVAGLAPGLMLLGISEVIIEEVGYIIRYADMGFLLVAVGLGVAILGYLVLLVSSFLAEALAAFASIANNTKEIATGRSLT